MNTKMEARNCMFNAVVVITWCFMLKVGASDPGINMLSQGCSTYNVSSMSNFISNLNITFGLVRTDLMNRSKKFVTEQSLSGPDSVYAMFQCRDYMSAADCIACFSAASTQIRNCSVANGARVVYDGCFSSGIFLDPFANELSVSPGKFFSSITCWFMVLLLQNPANNSGTEGC
ncbi:cysteine-rich receptor-like protein kinase 42 [Populus alba x Populus x berolinensis]|uniref:Cysteine-rich receptor-like protein kinase 42 n=1 Tax=Populus alba x Populus x berolinensis TaxID=444605 RepID=A0AAD6PV61_9ROSI|nr:cysteine-rich receptor-like protein kinase 42 [Populus alba x Populus x berolinensis]